MRFTHTNIVKSLIVIIVAVGAIACSSSKNYTKSRNNSLYIRKQLAKFPKIKGMEKRAIVLPFLKDNNDTANRKVEIIVGKQIKTDCNYHTLNGQIEHKTFNYNGLKYLIFSSNGTIDSYPTDCTDTLKTEKFITAKPIFLPYTPNKPKVIYHNKNYDVKYSIWQSTKPLAVNHNNNNSTESDKFLTFYPVKYDDMKRLTISLPKIAETNELKRYVEIIIKNTAKIEQKQKYIEKLQKKTTPAMELEYWTYSKSDILEDKNREKELVNSKNWKTIPYNSSVPIVLFVPKHIKVSYKIWTTDGELK